MPSNLDGIHNGIRRMFETIPGIETVLAFAPVALSDRLLFFSLTTGRLLDGGMQEIVMQWDFAGLLCVLWSNNEEADAQLRELTVQAFLAWATHYSAYGAIPDGGLEIALGQTEYRKSAGALYRCMNLTITAIEHFPVEPAF